jgi:hypothetical protein
VTARDFGRPSQFNATADGNPAKPNDFSDNIVKDPCHIHDFHATVLNLLGFDHEQFTFKYQGLDQRLTGVEPAKVIRELIA